MEIKDLQLTESDFKLLIDGLDALPEKGMAGELVGDLLIDIIAGPKKNNPHLANIDHERQKEKKQKQIEKDALKEEIKILQGKLLMFKRFLIETNALKQVNDLLK